MTYPVTGQMFLDVYNIYKVLFKTMIEGTKINIGRKVFFLYPHSVIQNEMVIELIRNEYEIYLLFDHMKAIKLLEKYNDSILFINIDEFLMESEWENYIKSLMNNTKTKNIRIGILTYNNDKALAEKYLFTIMVPCGYIKLSLGMKESTKIILKVLDANEVKGRRKYVRAKSEKMPMTEFNAKVGDTYYQGKIIDISSVGMACVFDKPVDIVLRTYIHDIQLKLKGVLCKVSGVVAGTRRDIKTIYVFLFDPKMQADTRGKISHFIFKSLQESIKEELF